MSTDSLPAPSREGVLAPAKRIVVKVGSGLLAGWGTTLDRGVARAIVDQVCELIDSDCSVVVVSSGAVALGCERLDLERRPVDIPMVQAAAAVGQGDLVALYQQHLERSGLTAAQVLLTHADLVDRRRFLNARHALNRLLGLGVVPIVNENDSVAVDELKVGDNDNLGAHVANQVGADLLVILTDIDGLHSSNPRLDPEARRIPLVRPDEAIPEGVLGEAGGDLSVGGMVTKVQAARKASAFGVPTVIVDGRKAGALVGAWRAEDRGTLFLPAVERQGSRKAWIAGLNPMGSLQLDAGATQAVLSGGRSLLPAGVTGVSGQFETGAPVRLLGIDGGEIGRGLTAYTAAELQRLMGCQTHEISERLGFHLGDEVVHRDDLVLTPRSG